MRFFLFHSDLHVAVDFVSLDIFRGLCGVSKNSFWVIASYSDSRNYEERQGVTRTPYKAYELDEILFGLTNNMQNLS